MKRRYTIYLSRPVADAFDKMSRMNGAKSALVEKALIRQIDPERIKQHDQAIIRRLDTMIKSIAIVERDVAIVTESLSLFVRYFLTITPPISKDDQDAARALGKERFQVFVGQVGRRLASDHRLVSEVLETVVATRPDLLAEDLDESPLKRPAGATITQFSPRTEASPNGATPSLEPEETQNV